MKKTSKILALVLSIVLCVSLLATAAFAAEVEQDGLKLTLTTDKSEYAANEQIQATLTVENKSGAAIEGLSLKHTAPTGYGVATGSTSKTVSLAVGASESLSVTYGVSDIPVTGDSTDVLLLIVAVVVSGVAVVCMFCNRKAACMALALLLVVGLTAPISANAASANVEVSTTVKVDGKDVTISASAAFEAAEPAPEVPDTIQLKANGEMTDQNNSTMPVALELNLDLVNNTATIYELATVTGVPDMHFYLLASDQNAPDIDGWGMAYMMCMEVGAGTVTANADGSYTATFTVSGFPVPFTVVNDGDGTWSCSMAPLVTMGLLNADVTAESVSE